MTALKSWTALVVGFDAETSTLYGMGRFVGVADLEDITKINWGAALTEAHDGAEASRPRSGIPLKVGRENCALQCAGCRPG